MIANIAPSKRNAFLAQTILTVDSTLILIGVCLRWVITMLVTSRLRNVPITVANATVLMFA